MNNEKLSVSQAELVKELDAVGQRVNDLSRDLCTTYDIRAVASIWFAEAGMMARAMRESGVIPMEQIGELFGLLIETAMSASEKPVRVVYGKGTDDLGARAN